MDLADVYRRYRELIVDHIAFKAKSLPILKCDTFNEAYLGSVHLEGTGLISHYVYYVELDPRTALIAKRNFPDRHIVVGDIRHLPFRDGHFSFLVDMSTIDHVHPSEAEGVLAEYARVLFPYGQLLMVAWCSENIHHRTQGPGWDQYYLDESQFRHWLNQRFHWSWMAELYRQPDKTYLLEVVARRLEDGHKGV